MNLLVICYITVISELLNQLYNLVTNEKCQFLRERRVKYMYIFLIETPLTLTPSFMI